MCACKASTIPIRRRRSPNSSGACSDYSRGAAIPLTIEPKVDGVAISLLYERGKFTRAVTRGDGTTGDDVTENIRTIRTIPHELGRAAPERIEIRGEIFLPKKEFARINTERDEQGLPAFANPRNAAAGSLKQLDTRIVATRGLGAVFYAFGLLEGKNPATQSEFMRWLEDWKMPVTGVAAPCGQRGGSDRRHS